jgi:hypothetical protein
LSCNSSDPLSLFHPFFLLFPCRDWPSFFTRLGMAPLAVSAR